MKPKGPFILVERVIWIRDMPDTTGYVYQDANREMWWALTVAGMQQPWKHSSESGPFTIHARAA